MIELLLIAEARGDGLIFTRDLRELGATSEQIDRAIRLQQLVRLRRGVYVRLSVDGDRRRDETHRLLVRGTSALSHGIVVSHLSAAAMHRLPLIGGWPGRVHISTPARTGGGSSAGTIAHRSGPPPETIEIDGVIVTSLARTLVDVAATCSFLVGVTMIDHALRTTPVRRGELFEELDFVAPTRGSTRARSSVEFGDGRSGSAGESLCRVRAFELGFHRPELQTRVATRHGNHDIDFEWPEVNLFGEFDGLVKYSRAEYMGGRSAQDVLLNEKNREDAIREATGRRFTRWLWNEALDPVLFNRRLLDAGVPRSHGRR